MDSKATTLASGLYDKHRERGFKKRSASINARHVLPHIQSHHRILDLGCGPGSITADLAELVPTGEVVGIDRNADSVESANSLARARQLGNISFHVADVKQYLSHTESESFDIVHAHQVLLHLSEPLEVMREARRVLKPGGLLSTVDSAMRVILPPLPGIISSDQTYERFSKSRGADPNFGQRHHVVAHEAGFDWDDVEITSWGMAEFDKESKANLAYGGGVASKMFVHEGLIDENEAREQDKDTKKWAALPDARWLELASALICWKR